MGLTFDWDNFAKYRLIPKRGRRSSTGRKVRVRKRTAGAAEREALQGCNSRSVQNPPDALAARLDAVDKAVAAGRMTESEARVRKARMIAMAPHTPVAVCS